MRVATDAPHRVEEDRLRVFTTPDHHRHNPRMFLARGVVKPNEERPERADLLLAAAIGAGHLAAEVLPATRADAATLHADDYLDFLEHGWARWAALPGAGSEISPNIHPNRNMDRRSRHPVAEAGWFVSDNACAIGAGTWTAALGALGAALAATDAVLAGAGAAYALCRPPGHHAYADMAGGGCFLNNVAAAALRARRVQPRVAVLDVDVHHGNGTQGLFYRRGDLLTVSLHADPAGFYPFYTGYADETGADGGAGANFNLPLPIGTGDAAYLAALDAALTRVREFKPGMLCVALGLDAAAGDPLGAFQVTTAGFAEIGRRIAALGLPTVLVQEGGYLSPLLGANLAAFLAAFGRDGHG